MKTKGFWLLAVVVSIFFLAAASHSEAACDQLGKVVYAFTTGATCYVYINYNTALPTFYYYYTTSDPEIIAAVNAAQAGNLKVQIAGNAASCPASGTYRYGGVISVFYTYSLY
jgi:hypothetical protein